MARVRGWQWVCGVVLVCGVMATVSHAQVTFSKLIDFDGTNGSYPYTILIQGTDGNLYGTTESGGTTGACFTGCGTVFKITSSGTLSTLYNFCSQSGCLDGGAPVGALVQAADGNFYGTTSAGGARGNGGTVFKITPGGSLTTLYSFCTLLQCADGEYPSAGLVQAANGAFYGTTRFGGAHGNGGTVYKITPAGVLTTLHSFCSLSNCADGGFSQSELVQARNGNLYGETATGNGVGTIFEITPNDEVSTLFTFDVIDGDYPAGGLIQGTNGNLYGTTAFGGVSNGGCPFFSQGCGTTFKLTSAGILTTLHNFCSSTNCADGDEPYDRMVQGSDGNFYGTTDGYDVSGGTIFEMTPSGALTTLYQFCVVPGCADGEVVYEGLTEVTDGTFYGTTFEGGLYGVGTVFSLSTGLAPFVKTRAHLCQGRCEDRHLRPRLHQFLHRAVRRSASLQRQTFWINFPHRESSCGSAHRISHRDQRSDHADQQSTVPRDAAGSQLQSSERIGGHAGDDHRNRFHANERSRLRRQCAGPIYRELR